ncbi:MAG TPA: threonine synthase [Flavisolibacter sp.]|nr:threonine synthase [Flavisolibacter sp.]
MNYYSTNNKELTADFRTATIKGQPEDRGLYFPSAVPKLQEGFIDNLEQLSKEKIAFEVIRPYVGDSIPLSELAKIIEATVNFDFPLVPIDGGISSLELFHGPTLAFKDVGARFMSRCLSYFARDDRRKVTVLVATSGDTGGAVANAFYDVPGVEVVILYPAGKVSSIQELQLTTLGKNVTALEVQGSFDDCQQMVKAAFSDRDLNQSMFLTSANSINVARWLPQQFYYFFAWQQWKDREHVPVISVPSGNFGNICAGLVARQSGLPIRHFIAACNANDIVPAYLQSGVYTPKPAVATLSNAMDVGDPSNFIRILELFAGSIGQLKEVVSGFTITDNETKKIIADVKKRNNYLLDPHGAVAYGALKKYLDQHPEEKGLILETAHPVKFYDVVEPVIHEKISLPHAVGSLLKKEKRKIPIKPGKDQLKEYLMQEAKM